MFGVPFNICTTAEDSDFKFGMPLALSRASVKAHPKEKKFGLRQGASRYLEVPLQYLRNG